ncbi:clptm1 domain containing protein [Niveomyces insectorum RCEF 264]|uniref:Clptm1 domain containing protein n=1 Tax=Niveomyces insectorum RCEF 264 TaxID=1081102 RepID=A0A168AI33_9HYPO|nr:clptm1 domain containing protein [Niveomyces insectorum RCEF 264]
MPEGNAAAAPAQGREEQGSSTTWRLLQIGAMWVGIQLVIRQFLPGTPTERTITTTDDDGNVVTVPANFGASPIPPYEARPRTLDEGATYNSEPQRLAPIWPDDSKLDIVISVSPTTEVKPLGAANADPVVFSEQAFGLGNFSDKRTVDTTIQVPPQVQNNGTLWGHFFVGLAGSVLDPYSPDYDRGKAYCFVFPLTQYIPKRKEVKTRNLLANAESSDNSTSAADAAAAAEEEEPATASGPIIASYYHPNASLSFVPGSGVIDYAATAPVIRQFVHVEATGARDGTGQNSWYYPVLFVNTFWQLKSHMTLLNDTVTTLPLHIDLNNLADWKFKIMANIEASGRENARQAAMGNQMPGGGDGSEIEMVKEIILDTNPYLLGVTVIVTIAHLLLEMLAFGSDISHYRKKKDNVGISVRSILANVFMQGVIFLYLIDNSQNTSWMILGSQGVGIVIELWKITTVVNVRLRDAAPGSLVPYRIVFEDKHQLTETEAKTKEYDEIAFKYMYWGGVPLLLAYAAYSLVYETHKSWYSFVITTLVGSVYAYGFLMMVPSLYINYRLKSVAHMPAKAMMYKFLNTFIDDLFAFTIKMPFLHRLATLRDDVIFFVYLYQRWAYRIDYTRVNEFGQGGDEDDEDLVAAANAAAAAKKDGNTTVAAAAATAAEATGADAKAAKTTTKRK